jgi:hypothetical protein
MRVLVASDKNEELKDIPGEQPRFYHEVDYVMRTWLEHRLHHLYPEAGGYNDQDEYLMRDWHTLSMYYIRVYHGEFTAFVMPILGVSIDTLTRD